MLAAVIAHSVVRGGHLAKKGQCFILRAIIAYVQLHLNVTLRENTVDLLAQEFVPVVS
jgi:hypothetical protein